MKRFLRSTIITGLALTGFSTVASAIVPVDPDTSTASYRKGSTDRDAWESWFSSLSGDVLAGASYWAENRSHNPISCGQMAAQSQASYVWLAACNEAQRHLTPVDYYRKTDAQYWNGWNKKVAVAAFVPGIPGEIPAPVQTVPAYYPPIQPTYAPAPVIPTEPNQLVKYCSRHAMAVTGGNFDVYYDAATEHYHTLGDSTSGFQWKKCMTENGKSIGPTESDSN